MFLVHIIHNMSIGISSGNSPKLYLLLNRHVSWRFFLSYILFMLIYIMYIKKMVSKVKSVFNVTKIEKISKMVTLTCI